MAIEVRWLARRRALIPLCVATMFATAMLAYHLAPWFDAGPVPVQLWVDAQNGTSIKVFCDERATEGLVFVAVSNGSEAHSPLWLAELPPLPQYRLKIVFDPPVKREALKELILLNVRDLDQPFYRARVTS